MARGQRGSGDTWSRPPHAWLVSSCHLVTIRARGGASGSSSCSAGRSFIISPLFLPVDSGVERERGVLYTHGHNSDSFDSWLLARPSTFRLGHFRASGSGQTVSVSLSTRRWSVLRIATAAYSTAAAGRWPRLSVPPHPNNTEMADLWPVAPLYLCQ